jgi:hypothetical protein
VLFQLTLSAVHELLSRFNCMYCSLMSQLPSRSNLDKINFILASHPQLKFLNLPITHSYIYPSHRKAVDRKTPHFLNPSIIYRISMILKISLTLRSPLVITPLSITQHCWSRGSKLRNSRCTTTILRFATAHLNAKLKSQAQMTLRETLIPF